MIHPNHPRDVHNYVLLWMPELFEKQVSTKKTAKSKTLDTQRHSEVIFSYSLSRDLASAIKQTVVELAEDIAPYNAENKPGATRTRFCKSGNMDLELWNQSQT